MLELLFAWKEFLGRNGLTFWSLLAIVGLCFFVLFFTFRELICWYLKINRTLTRIKGMEKEIFILKERIGNFEKTSSLSTDEKKVVNEVVEDKKSMKEPSPNLALSEVEDSHCEKQIFAISKAGKIDEELSIFKPESAKDSLAFFLDPNAAKEKDSQSFRILN